MLLILFFMMAWRWSGWWPWCSHNGLVQARDQHACNTNLMCFLHCADGNEGAVPMILLQISWDHFNQVHLISKTRWLVLYLQASGQPDPCQNECKFFNHICISSLRCRLCSCPSLWTWGTSLLPTLVILAATSNATIWQELNAEPWGPQLSQHLSTVARLIVYLRLSVL